MQQDLYHVYHSLNPLSTMYPDGEFWTEDDSNSSHFREVANVIAKSPDEVFSLMQNDGETPWTDHPEVTWSSDTGLRSTSVGDVIFCYRVARAWLVLSEGFQDISRVFAVVRNNALVVCEKHLGGDYVLRFLPKWQAERCWRIIGRSGRWSGVLHIEAGWITYPKDLVSIKQLREIAVQFLDGKTRIEFSEDEDEVVEDEDEVVEDREEDKCGGLRVRVNVSKILAVVKSNIMAVIRRSS
jgi:hypothetical protein